MTDQTADEIIIAGVRYWLLSEPLSDVFRRLGRQSQTICSANWRGYMAIWEINDDSLYLIGFSSSYCSIPYDPNGSKGFCGIEHAGYCDEQEQNLEDLFPGSNGKVFANWVSESLIVPQGDTTKYFGYQSTYPSYHIFHVADGILTGIDVISSLPGSLLAENAFDIS